MRWEAVGGGGGCRRRLVEVGGDRRRPAEAGESWRISAGFFEYYDTGWTGWGCYSETVEKALEPCDEITLELTVDLTQVITLNLEHRAGRERREQRQSED